jgi:uncharacterized repeat protein (TIGR01451 family)
MPTPVSVSGNTITWNIGSITSGNYLSFFVPLTPLSTTVGGDTACNYALNTPTTGDLNTVNNVVSICDSIRSSWDPNEMTVSPERNIQQDSLLTYSIQFENLGNDTAFNIHIQDTLSQYLDARSLRLLSSTHPVSITVYQDGGKDIVKFDFPGINLGDKNHPLSNKGVLTYSIRTSTGQIFSEIDNSAGIYYDANPVVMTNTASYKVITPSGVSNPSRTAGLKVYPNPATSTFNIQVSQDEWSEALLINSLGQTLVQRQLGQGSNVLPIAELPSGIYYLQIKGTDSIHTEKIEKR